MGIKKEFNNAGSLQAKLSMCLDLPVDAMECLIVTDRKQSMHPMVSPKFARQISMPVVSTRFARQISASEREQKLVDAIFDRIATIQNVYPSDATGWHKDHIRKVRQFIRENRPIEFVLPAFPFKSANREKTVDHLPDMGTVLALGTLNKLCAEIKEIYPPGAHLLICSDGRVFSDLCQVLDEHVDQYNDSVEKILKEFNYTHLSTFDLYDVYSERNGPKTRAALVEDYAESEEQVRSNILKKPEAMHFFLGIKRFVYEDLLVLNKECTNSQLQRRSKTDAYEVIRRSNAWSSVVDAKFPHAVRMSIHPQRLDSAKIGICLLATHDNWIWRTPWHSVALLDAEGKFSLVKRSTADELGAILKKQNDKYYYYEMPASV